MADVSLEAKDKTVANQNNLPNNVEELTEFVSIYVFCYTIVNELLCSMY